jgi:hypothetical protein
MPAIIPVRHTNNTGQPTWQTQAVNEYYCGSSNFFADRISLVPHQPQLPKRSFRQKLIQVSIRGMDVLIQRRRPAFARHSSDRRSLPNGLEALHKNKPERPS